MEQVGQGMIPPGKYVNRLTGKAIHVRDSVQDGESLLIISDQGQLTMKEFSEYIQVEEGEELYIPNVNDLYGDKKPNQQLLAEINRGIDPEDRIKIGQNDNSCMHTEVSNDGSTVITTIATKQKPTNKNYDLIKKVLDKFPVERTINFEIVEEEWPFKEFNMLVNVLDVPIKDICDYVIDNFFDKEHLSSALSKYFEEHIK